MYNTGKVPFHSVNTSHWLDETPAGEENGHQQTLLESDLPVELPFFKEKNLRPRTSVKFKTGNSCLDPKK